MPAGQILSGPALARALRSDFINTWRKRYEVQREKLGRIMELGIASENFVEIYGYGEAPIYPARTPWGEAPEREPHKYRTYEVENLRWTSEVLWLRRDRELSNLGDVQSQAQLAGNNWGTLAERVFFQILTDGTDRKLLEAVPTAPDGAAFFSATDGDGNDRFGFSGGNVSSGETWTTGEAVRTGFFGAIEDMLQYLDDRGEPALDEAVLEEGITYIYPVTRKKQVHEAFDQQFTALGATSATSNAAVTNVVLDAGLAVTLYGTPRISTDSAYLFANSFDVKPVFEQVALPLEETFIDKTTSEDHARRGLESIMWEMWAGYGLNLPLGSHKLTT